MAAAVTVAEVGALLARALAGVAEAHTLLRQARDRDGDDPHRVYLDAHQYRDLCCQAA